MKTCQKCSASNDETKKVCDQCGSALVGELENFLVGSGLRELLTLFESNDIRNLDQLMSLGSNDIKDLQSSSGGRLAFGDLIKLRKAIEGLKQSSTPASPQLQENRQRESQIEGHSQANDSFMHGSGKINSEGTRVVDGGTAGIPPSLSPGYAEDKNEIKSSDIDLNQEDISLNVWTLSHGDTRKEDPTPEEIQTALTKLTAEDINKIGKANPNGKELENTLSLTSPEGICAGIIKYLYNEKIVYSIYFYKKDFISIYKKFETNDAKNLLLRFRSGETSFINPREWPAEGDNYLSISSCKKYEGGRLDVLNPTKEQLHLYLDELNDENYYFSITGKQDQEDIDLQCAFRGKNTYEVEVEGMVVEREFSFDQVSNILTHFIEGEMGWYKAHQRVNRIHELITKAIKYLQTHENETIGSSSLQRVLRIKYSLSKDLLDELQKQGILEKQSDGINYKIIKGTTPPPLDSKVAQSTSPKKGGVLKFFIFAGILGAIIYMVIDENNKREEGKKKILQQQTEEVNRQAQQLAEQSARLAREKAEAEENARRAQQATEQAEKEKQEALRKAKEAEKNAQEVAPTAAQSATQSSEPTSSPGFLGLNVGNGEGHQVNGVKTLIKGAFVTGVVSGSPAERAGIRKDDLVVSIGGVTVNDAQEMTEQIQRHGVGDVITVGLVQGNGSTATVSAQLVSRSELSSTALEEQSSARASSSQSSGQQQLPEGFSDFFKQYVRDHASNNPWDLAYDYADPCYYCYANGNASRAYIYDDIRKLVQAYPQRSYTDVNVDNISVVSPDTVRLRYHFNYQYSGKKLARGTSTVDLEVRNFSGKWQITSFSEQVTRR